MFRRTACEVQRGMCGGHKWQLGFEGFLKITEQYAARCSCWLSRVKRKDRAYITWEFTCLTSHTSKYTVQCACFLSQPPQRIACSAVTNWFFHPRGWFLARTVTIFKPYSQSFLQGGHVSPYQHTVIPDACESKWGKKKKKSKRDLKKWNQLMWALCYFDTGVYDKPEINNEIWVWVYGRAQSYL